MVPIRDRVEQLLSDYGLEHETAKKYIEASTRLNRTKTAEELDVSRQTIQKYKNSFAEMSHGERVFVIQQLSQELYQDYFDEKVIEEVE